MRSYAPNMVLRRHERAPLSAQAERMLQPDEARAIVLRHARVLAPEVHRAGIDWRAHSGRGSDRRCRVCRHSDAATMDGYAVVHDDETVARAGASDPALLGRPLLTVTRGTAAKIMTGAPIPRGATTVVPD